MMNDITDLMKVQKETLNSLEGTLPKTIENCIRNKYLVYTVDYGDGSVKPVIDFERKMPNNYETYYKLIKDSYAEIAETFGIEDYI